MLKHHWLTSADSEGLCHSWSREEAAGILKMGDWESSCRDFYTKALTVLREANTWWRSTQGQLCWEATATSQCTGREQWPEISSREGLLKGSRDVWWKNAATGCLQRGKEEAGGLAPPTRSPAACASGWSQMKAGSQGTWLTRSVGPASGPQSKGGRVANRQ